MGDFMSIPEKEVWQQWGAQAGREGINLYPTATPTTWWAFRRPGGPAAAVYGLATLKRGGQRGGQRLRGVWVPQMERAKGYGSACIRDAMDRSDGTLDTLDYDPEPYLSLGWTQVGERNGIYHMAWTRS